jgi:nucleoside-diphosphate-sugar epimerase
MIVAITGGSGFIGRKLVMHHLEQGDEVRVLSRRPPEKSELSGSVKWYCGDLNNSEELQSFVDKADVLYHCAGEIKDTTKMEVLHVDGTLRLINAATGRIGRWVQLSSTGAYGLHRDGVVTEETSLNPIGTYEVTKVQSDNLVVNAANKGAFNYVILRPSIVYGETMGNGSLFSLISLIQRGWFFFIGCPAVSANYIHVDNVVKAMLLCGSVVHANGKVYNLSDHRNLEDFVKIITGTLGCKMPHLRLPELPVRILIKLLGWIPAMPLTDSRINALTNRTIYENTRIEIDLGYQHEVSMEDGLTKLVVYWKSNMVRR